MLYPYIVITRIGEATEVEAVEEEEVTYTLLEETNNP